MARTSLGFLVTLLFSPALLASELVILLSWDGFRHDYMDRADFPALQQMATEGIRSQLIPGYPSDTFPGHVTLATGTDIGGHGIVANRFLDREMGLSSYSGDAKWLNAEPLWVTVERQGKKSAVYYWVGSETEWQRVPASYLVTPFNADTPEADKVDQILAWVDLPASERPNLIMSYWRGADSVGHIKGHDHPEVLETLAVQDKQLQRLINGIELAGLWSSTTLIVVSDHGMTNVTQVIPVTQTLMNANIPATVVGGSSVKRIFLDQPGQQDIALATLKALGDVTVYDKAQIPQALRYDNRTGDIVVTTTPPNMLDTDTSLLAQVRSFLLPVLGWNTGAHGFASDHPDMAATFLAMGAGVDSDVELERVEQRSIAATVTQLLGLDAPRDAIGEPVQLAP